MEHKLPDRENPLSKVFFRDAILNQHEALDNLQTIAFKNRTKNASILTEKLIKGELKSDLPMDQHILNFKIQIDDVYHLGLGITDEIMINFYEIEQDWPNEGELYEDVLVSLFKFSNPTTKDSIEYAPYSVDMLNLLLDLKLITKGSIATDDQWMQSVITAMRKSESGFNAFKLGKMIDDALHFRGQGDSNFNINVDFENTKHLRDLFLRNANQEEKGKFKNGIIGNYLKPSEIYLN